MKVIIIGAGGQGKVVLDILRVEKRCEVMGFIDNSLSMRGSVIQGVPVIGDLSVLPELVSNDIKGAIVAIGDNKTRAKTAEAVVKAGLKLINAIHPTAIISPDTRMGVNNVIAAGAIICTDVCIGNNVIINTGAIIEHENIIEDNVHISPGSKLGGQVTVKKGAHIGIGSTLIQNITVYEYSIVGAGAVVLEDVPAGTTVVGIPAKGIKR